MRVPPGVLRRFSLLPFVGHVHEVAILVGIDDRQFVHVGYRGVSDGAVGELHMVKVALLAQYGQFGAVPDGGQRPAGGISRGAYVEAGVDVYRRRPCAPTRVQSGAGLGGSGLWFDRCLTHVVLGRVACGAVGELTW